MNVHARTQEAVAFEEQTIPQEAEPTIHSADRQRRSFSRMLVGRHLADAVEHVLPPDSGPHLIAHGGEHLVFEVPRKNMPDSFRDIVIKVNFVRSGAALLAPAEDRVASELQLRKQLEESIKEKQAKVLELRRYFGYDAVPAHKTFIRDVPVTLEIFQSLYPGFQIDAKRVPKTTPALVSVQRRLELSGEGEQYVSLTGNYPERRLASLVNDPRRRERESSYDRAHDLLTGRRERSDDPRQDITAICRMYPKMRPIAHLAEQNPAFKQKLGDVVERLIAYSRDTHRCLDLAGRNNMTLMESDGAWKLKMLDVLHGGDFSFDDLERIIAEMMNREIDVQDISLRREEAWKALNPLNTLRVINALAFISGRSGDLLNVPGVENVSASVWRTGILACMSGEPSSSTSSDATMIDTRNL